MRERLIELMNNAELDCLEFSKMHPYEKSLTAFTADYLLANGVIVPPVKVGQTVWVKVGNVLPHIAETQVIYVMHHGEQLFSIGVESINSRGNIGRYWYSDFGKKVFLTKEEAENALGGVRDEEERACRYSSETI